jgi:co-chaperonin GroES (HSP10)
MIKSSGRSAELNQDSRAYIAANEQIRMRLDYMLVEPLERDLSKTLTVVENTKPVRGRVIAIGPGTHPKVYDHPDKHKRKSFEYSSRFLETQVKPGDLVELGGIDIGGYSFPQIMYGDKKYLICRELDVSGVLDG